MFYSFRPDPAKRKICLQVGSDALLKFVGRSFGMQESCPQEDSVFERYHLLHAGVATLLLSMAFLWLV